MSRRSPGSTAPPRLAEWVVCLFLPEEERQELLGDLHERWASVCNRHGPMRAGLWYWAQAIGALPRLVHGRFSSVPRRGRLRTTQGWSLGALGHPLRMLRREPGFSLAAVAVLAVGIAVPTTMYSIEHGIFRSLPVHQPSQVVAVQRTDPRSRRDLGFSDDAFEELRNGLSSMQLVASYRTERFQLDSWEGTASLVSGAAVTPDIFPLLGIPPLLGRSLVVDDASSAADVVVIGERLWRDELGARDDILGHVIRVNGVHRTVVGVMPERFGFPVNGRAWIPLHLDTARPGASSPPLQVVARLRDGVPLSRARAEIAALVAGLDAAMSEPRPTATAVPFQATFLGNGTVARAMLLIFSFLLIIAAANVANLLLVRAVRRGKEISLRMALGASRRRIVVEQLAQSLLLSGLGAIGGIMLAGIGMEWFRRTFGGGIDVWWVSLRLDASTIWFAAASGVLVSVIAGIAPALQSSAVEIQNAMKGSTPNSFRHARFSRASLAIQIALSCTMLILVTQIVRGVARSTSSFDGLGAEGVLVGQIHIGDFDYPNASARASLARSLADEFATLPGGAGAALANALPGGPAPSAQLMVQGTADSDPALRAQVRRITPGFLPLFRVDVLEGRSFEARAGIANATTTGESSVPVEAVIDERLARLMSPQGSAVGMRVRLEDDGAAATSSAGAFATVIGIVRDPGVSVDSRGTPQPTIFLPLAAATPSDLVLLIRGAPAVSMTDLREGVARIDRHLPLTRTGTLSGLLQQSRALERRLAGLFALFGTVALALASVGLYAIVAFSVGRRTKEIGIQRALGASALQVIRGTFRGIVAAVTTGLLVGTTIAFIAAPAIKPLLWGEGAQERGAFLLVPVLLAVISVFSAALPGRKATAMDPMRALRAE